MNTNNTPSSHALFTNLPYYTNNIQGTGGIIRLKPEDFRVEEIPLYPFSGKGTHTIIQLEKKGLGTMEAIALLADYLKIHRYRFGYAGMKDAQAITTQWISIQDIEPIALDRIKIPGIRILSITKHENTIKLGHLKGNQFIIRLRKLNCPLGEALDLANQTCEILSAEGFPNYFGPQRFGNRLDSHLLGYALIQNNLTEFADLMLGRPNDFDTGKIAQARAKYDQSNYNKARKLWPYPYANQRKALHLLVKNGGKKHKVAFLVKSELKNLYVSAWQSYIFNQVLAARMPKINTILEGDMAYCHDSGSVFRVEDIIAEQKRCDANEISPTGPLPGLRLSSLSGAAGKIENQILQENQVNEEANQALKKYYARTSRRSLVAIPRELKCSGNSDKDGDYIQLEFILPAGCFATSLLREITKKPNFGFQHPQPINK